MRECVGMKHSHTSFGIKHLRRKKKRRICSLIHRRKSQPAPFCSEVRPYWRSNVKSTPKRSASSLPDCAETLLKQLQNNCVSYKLDFPPTFSQAVYDT